MPQDRQRRKRSRSFSPVPAKQKRSWQNNESDRPPRAPQRSPSPGRAGKKQYSKHSPSFSGRRDRPVSPAPRGARRSSSPGVRKRPLSRSPEPGLRAPPSPGARLARDGPPARHDSRGTNIPPSRQGSMSQRQRSISPRPVKKAVNDRAKPDPYYSKRSPSPTGQRYHGKKKQRFSISPPPPSAPLPPPHSSSSHHHHHSAAPKPSVKQHSASRRSPSPLPPPPLSSGYRSGPSSSKKVDGLPQRRVSSSGKKKPSRLTLHKRFTTEDQGPFRLEENVTIAILRNPNAEPSEEVTVKRVFDSGLFKMIHKKTEGRRPIFDREEIKVWRHDENLADDPDFERRLVRVKSSSQTSGSKVKPASDSLSRMSPDVIRKAFGLQVGARSKSRSPHREPQIRLDPKPDPRYESKYRQQMEKEERRRGSDVRDKSFDKVDKERHRSGREEDDHRDGETYDLRHALERRRSDRDDVGSYRYESHREEGKASGSFYRSDYKARPSSPGYGSRGRQVISGSGDARGSEGGRNVVFGSGGGRGGEERYDNLSPDRDGGGQRGWEVDRGGRGFRGRVIKNRGRGRGQRGRRDWSPDHRGGDREDFRSREHSTERRARYSHSPSSNRGWRGNRSRGRGRGRDFNSPYRATEIISPAEIDDSFKYTQHDDRDVSPKTYRGRGRGRGRGRFPARSFGSNNFRGARGGYRGRVFRGKSFGSLRDRDTRSPDRGRDRSADREWKHDMYDSLQTEEEQPHSTTVSS